MALNPFLSEEMLLEDNDLMLFEDGDTMLYENYTLNSSDMLWFLPKYYYKDSGVWVDLSFAFKATTEGWSDLAKNFRNGYIFHLATSEQLTYLEEMLKVPVDETLSTEYRAGRLTAKLVRKVTTKEVILGIAKQFYPNEPNPILNELGADYTLSITFSNMQVLPVDIDVFKNTVYEILQADLDFIVDLDIAMSAFTHDELALNSHDNLVAYKQSA